MWSSMIRCVYSNILKNSWNDQQFIKKNLDFFLNKDFGLERVETGFNPAIVQYHNGTSVGYRVQKYFEINESFQMNRWKVTIALWRRGKWLVCEEGLKSSSTSIIYAPHQRYFSRKSTESIWLTPRYVALFAGGIFDVIFCSMYCIIRRKSLI